MNARQINPQVIRANQARRDVIWEVENAVRKHASLGGSAAFELPTTLESELTMVAPRPTSLGFNEVDFFFFIGPNETGFPGYASFLMQALKERSGANARVLNASHVTPELIKKRGLCQHRVKYLQLMVDTLKKEIARREDLKLQSLRDFEAQRAILAADIQREEAEAGEILSSLPPLSLKIPVKRKSKTVVKRSDFSTVIKTADVANPFEVLKGEVTARSRANWKTRAIKKAEALEIAACTAEELDSARAFAQKMGTDEVMELESGVIRTRKSGNSVRYEYFGA